MSEEGDAILEVRGVVKRFGGLKALDEADVRIRHGELVGIIGPNGAGKSTLFNVITGALNPDSGRVLFEGRDITGFPPHRISRLGIARKFQVPSVFDELTVRHNLRVAGRGHTRVSSLLRIPAGRSDEQERVLDRLGLSQKADRPAGTLSHGEKQWLEIGMVLANRPRLLLLDEPTAGMTIAETKQTEDLLRTLGTELTIAVIEHDVRFIREVAQRVVVLHRGKVLAEGTIDEVETDERVRDVYLGREE